MPTLLGGGSERVIVNLLRQLNRARFEASLAVVDLRGAAYLDDMPPDVEVLDLGKRRIRYAVLRIIGIVWRRRPDVVFSTLGHLNLTLGLLRPLLPHRVRYVARETIVVSELLRTLRLGRILTLAYRLLYRSYDSIVCLSRDMAEDLVQNIKLSRDKLVLIPNPVDVDHVRALARHAIETGMTRARGEIHLVAAGRLVPQKGFDLLLEAVALCTRPEFVLTILGEGPLRAELEDLARQKGISSRVRFVGFQQNPYVFFAQADAFVLSSRYEGLPNVVLEAMACGTPVVATPAPGGVRELLEGKAGCCIASGVDSRALADALSRVVPGHRLRADVVNAYDAGLVMRSYERLLSPNTRGAPDGSA